MRVLDQVRQGTQEHRLMPFLWMHGEDEQTLLLHLQKIRECGIDAVCLEARPHPDFVGEGWWRDVDIIMEEARRTGMRVWILDDKAFPTGSANGMAEKAPDSLRRRFVQERHVDVCGPLPGAALLLQDDELTDRLLAITAFDRETKRLIEIPLSAVSGDAVYWDIPPGVWRVCVFSQKLYGNEYTMPTYLDPLIRESTQILIDTVYTPHIERYAADLGKTFAGFFSDEPGFYTVPDYGSRVGDPETLLLWTPDMAQQLEQLSGRPIGQILTAIYHEIPGRSAAARRLYMDHATALYRDNFCGAIGTFCRAHGIEYMGHVIEDNNAHARPGYGAGHFFRALEGQTYAGIDIVLHQIIPGMGDLTHTACLGGGSHGTADGVFFTYLLAQMAASQARLDPHKRGRAMCEIFGAFGWSEGTKMMKWMADFMLVRGINTFVPHAFSPAPFPDPDCPPHFYAQGSDPLFLPFTHLCRYMDRAAHLLSGGECPAPVAVLYHAEAEWTGSEAMLTQVPARELTRAQIPFDIVSEDHLQRAVFSPGAFSVGGARYEALVIPGRAVMTDELLTFLDRLDRHGVPYRFVGRMPDAAIDRQGAHPAAPNGDAICPEQLPQWLCRFRLPTGMPCPDLRARRYRHPDGTVWMLTNEHPFAPLTTSIDFPEGKNGVLYDPMENTVSPLPQGEWTIGPYESRFVIFSTDLPDAPQPAAFAGRTVTVPDGAWRIKTATAADYPHMTPYREGASLQNLNTPDGLPRFSGILRYETTIDGCGTPALIDLGAVFECAEVWVDDDRLGLRLAPPYRFIVPLLGHGRHRLRVEVRCPLGHAERDMFSRYLPLEPIGLLGPVTLTFSE